MAILVSAGVLDQQITVQQMTVARGPLGGHDETWANFATVWAQVLDLTGREIYNGKEMGSAVNVQCTCRYRTDIVPAMRVILPDGTMARIEYIERVSRHAYIVLYCLLLND